MPQPKYRINFMDGSSVTVSAPNVEAAKRKARAPRVNKGGPGFQPQATITQTKKISEKPGEAY